MKKHSLIIFILLFYIIIKFIFVFLTGAHPDSIPFFLNSEQNGYCASGLLPGCNYFLQWHVSLGFESFSFQKSYSPELCLGLPRTQSHKKFVDVGWDVARPLHC